MSWTNECTASNWFKTKNNEEVTEVLETMGFDVYTENDKLYFVADSEGAYFDDMAEVVLSIQPREIDGKVKNLFGIISDCINDSVDVDELQEEYNLDLGKDIMVVPIVEYLEDMLEEDNGIVITSAGFESRSSGSYSPFGDVFIIVKDKNGIHEKSMSLYKFMKEVEEETGVKL